MTPEENRPAASAVPDPADATALMRWVASDPGRFNVAKSPALQPGAFVPNPADADGISMSLLNAHFRSPEEYLQSSANERVRAYGGVATLSVSQLLGLGLTVARTPTAEDPGHVSIPEMNAADYAQAKQAIKALAVRLAELATVVIEPKLMPPKPTE